MPKVEQLDWSKLMPATPEKPYNYIEPRLQDRHLKKKKPIGERDESLGAIEKEIDKPSM